VQYSLAGRRTERVIQPFVVAYYAEATLAGAWCELRNDIRHFRTDRIVAAAVLDEPFKIQMQ
jgi:predicted DNA-binding transcriptional regulator YafY